MWLITNSEVAAGIASLDKEIERASDRAVAVLAGSIVETYLTRLVRHHLHDPDGKVWAQRAHPSGPFGSFALKIDLAFMVGLISEEARKDLIVIKDVRNRFAHDLDVSGFDDQSIAAKCENLTLIDQHIGDWAPGVLEQVMAAQKAGDMDLLAKLVGRVDRIIVSGSAAEMRTPRGRFIWAARLFGFRFGLAAQGHLPAKLGQRAI